MAVLARTNRVVVTGLGALAASGIGLDEFWASLLSCSSGIGSITLFDAAQFPIKIAGEVKEADLARLIPGSIKPRRHGRHTQLALAAMHMSLADAKLAHEQLAAERRVPVYVGVSTSAIEVIEQGMDQLTWRGPDRVSPYIVGACQPHAVASVLAESLGVETEVLTISNACPAGLDAVAAAATAIRSGRTELAIAGGTDAPVTPLTVASFGATGMVPSWSGDPKKASRPFDRQRCGGIMAEGAGFAVLESLEHALARGARPYIEIAGHGSSVDAPGTEAGAGLEVSMNLALANAHCLPHHVDYVCAHGPSDRVIDRLETACIKTVLGRHARTIPISSIKGVIGNPLAAAGPLELVACALALRNGIVPPTANYEYADPDCDLDYVPNKPRKVRIGRAILNVHGMGGVNSSLVVQRIT